MAAWTGYGDARLVLSTMLYLTGTQVGVIVVVAAFVVIVVIMIVGFWRGPERWNGPIARRLRAGSEHGGDAGRDRRRDEDDARQDQAPAGQG